MLTVTDYARKLLHEHDCVVVPELGGFLAHFNHAFFSPQNGLYHAPQKRVAFNEALKLDDGLLVHYLVVNELLTREDAQVCVRQFAENIKNEIKEKGECLLNGIGTLSANYEGKLMFEPIPNVNFYGESYGFESIKADSLAPTVKIEEVESEEVWQTNDREAESLPFMLPHRRSYSRAVWYSAAGIALTGALIWGGFSSNNLQSSLNPAAVIPTIQSYFAKKTIEAKPKPVAAFTKKVAVVPQPTTVAPIPTAAPEKTVALPKVEPKKEIIKKENKAVLPEVKEEDKTVLPEVKEKDKAVLPEVKEDVAITKLLANDEAVNYYIVAGSFSKLDNAQKLEQKLKNAGYQHAFIMNPNATDGELIKVVVIGLDNFNKAKQQLKAVNRLTGTKSCVVKK